jgi:hypothetical protein
MEQLLVFFLAPFRLLDARVEPLVPAGLALLWRLADEQRADARPLILAILELYHQPCAHLCQSCAARTLEMAAFRISSSAVFVGERRR